MKNKRYNVQTVKLLGIVIFYILFFHDINVIWLSGEFIDHFEFIYQRI